MSPLLATYIKINSLTSMLAEDKALLKEAKLNPHAAFAKRGIDLTPEESKVIVDIIHDTRKSALSKRPKKPRDWVNMLHRQLGHAVRE
ncbi:hypothetical protein ACT4MK_36930 [Bradyrhizobium barranii]|uniref:hypothetical protein n=1 Tax=Bradyrhizobium TaxID=374 RepID=UPI003F24C8EC